MINISVILVSGGNPEDSVGRYVELLHTNGSRICSLPDLPYSRYQHSQTGVTACGGSDGTCGGGTCGGAAPTSCHTLSSTGSWEVSYSLYQRRVSHSAWDSPQGTVLLGGEVSGGVSALTTSEILLESGDTTPGFNLIDRTG